MFYDVEKIKEEVKPIDVVSYLGIEIKRSGKNIYIPCPEHAYRLGKNDQHATNCILGKTFNNAYYCFSCNGHGNVFNLIAFHEGLDIKTDFAKICKIAIESIGNSNDFLLKDVQKNKGQKTLEKIKYPILSEEQYEKIGLRKNININKINDSYKTYELVEDEKCLFYPKISFEKINNDVMTSIDYLDLDRSSIGMTEICKKDPELYYKIVYDACFSKIQHYNNLINKLDEHNNQEKLGLTKTDISLIISVFQNKCIDLIEIMNEMEFEDIPQLDFLEN